jgi:hypothetical protein
MRRKAQPNRAQHLPDMAPRNRKSWMIDSFSGNLPEKTEGRNET